MKNTITILFVLIALSAGAQKIRFTDSTNQWTTLSFNGGSLCSFENSFGYGADTTILGTTYRIMTELSSTFLPGVCIGTSSGCYSPAQRYFIREDTTAGIGYIFNPADTAEHMLFNYNLHVGDSFLRTYSVWSDVDTVVSVDSTLINGVYHKILNMQNTTTWEINYTVLEGVGI